MCANFLVDSIQSAHSILTLDHNAMAQCFKSRVETLRLAMKSQGAEEIVNMREGQPAEFAVIILVTVIVSAVVILIWSLTLRYKRRELQHKERLAAIEKGAPAPPQTNIQHRTPWTPRTYLLRGMMWLFGGIGMMLF